jgi:hypothetical protein
MTTTGEDIPTHQFEYTSESLEQGRGLPGRQRGLIAQEVERVFPDWVGRDEAGRLYVTERATTALMVEALRDLRAEKDAQIEKLRAEKDAEIERLRAQSNAELTALKNRLERLDRLVSQLANSTADR